MRLRFEICKSAARAALSTIQPVLKFFFSSRRRHTRWPRDWSSDVCSSDLVLTGQESLFPGAVQGLRGLVDKTRHRGKEDRSEERRVGKECRSRFAPD